MKNLLKKTIKKIDEDNFIKRLPSSVIGQGMLHEGNIYLMNLAIVNMPKDGYVLEIGSYAGLSTNLILHLLEKHQKDHQFIGCDAWIYEGYNDSVDKEDIFIDDKRVKRNDYMNYIKDAFISSTQLLHPNRLPFTCHLTSDAFFEKWENNEAYLDVFGRKFTINKNISFSYIDGNHSYEQTKKDFQNVTKHLLPKGYILLDDSADYMSFGSAKFISEIKSNPNFKIVDKNPNYLIQKIK